MKKVKYTTYFDAKTLETLRQLKIVYGKSIRFMIDEAIKEYLSKFL